MEKNNVRVIARIRERAGLPVEEFSDEKVAAWTKGTCLEALVELELAYEDVGVNIQTLVNEIRSKMRKDIEKHLIRLFSQ